MFLHTQTDILFLQHTPILLLQVAVDPTEGNGIVSGIPGEDGGGSQQDGCLGPHQAHGKVMFEGRVTKVAHPVEVVMD